MKETHPSTRGATTHEILTYFEYETNLVTKATYRQILGNRIDEGRYSRSLLGIIMKEKPTTKDEWDKVKEIMDKRNHH